MRWDKSSIDDRFDQPSIPTKPQHGKLAQWFVPVWTEYDAYGEAKKLINDPIMRKLGMSEEEAALHLQHAYENHRHLLNMAGTADTVDKYRSLILEHVGEALVAAGVTLPLGGILYVVGQGIEWYNKLPIINRLRKDELPANQQLGKNLLFWELLSIVPGLGFIMDFQNHYVHAVEHAITNYARKEIFTLYEKEIDLLYPQRRHRVIDVEARAVPTKPPVAS